MKTCPSCNEPKSLKEFAWKQKSRGIRQSSCNNCRRKKAKQYYYSTDKEKAIARARRSGDRRIAYYKELKDNGSCVSCGEQESVCLDFHHLDESTKEFEISSAIRQVGLQKLQEEIAKCVLLCANCHRKVHANLLHL